MWLSLVEHVLREHGVGGSNPLIPTSISKGLRIFRNPFFCLQIFGDGMISRLQAAYEHTEIISGQATANSFTHHGVAKVVGLGLSSFGSPAEKGARAVVDAAGAFVSATPTILRREA
jgi:hypothetical protein